MGRTTITTKTRKAGAMSNGRDLAVFVENKVHHSQVEAIKEL